MSYEAEMQKQYDLRQRYLSKKALSDPVKSYAEIRDMASDKELKRDKRFIRELSSDFLNTLASEGPEQYISALLLAIKHYRSYKDDGTTYNDNFEAYPRSFIDAQVSWLISENSRDRFLSAFDLAERIIPSKEDEKAGRTMVNPYGVFLLSHIIREAHRKGNMELTAQLYLKKRALSETHKGIWTDKENPIIEKMFKDAMAEDTVASLKLARQIIFSGNPQVDKYFYNNAVCEDASVEFKSLQKLITKQLHYDTIGTEPQSSGLIEKVLEHTETERFVGRGLRRCAMEAACDMADIFRVKGRYQEAADMAVDFYNQSAIDRQYLKAAFDKRDAGAIKDNKAKIENAHPYLKRIDQIVIQNLEAHADHLIETKNWKEAFKANNRLYNTMHKIAMQNVTFVDIKKRDGCVRRFKEICYDHMGADEFKKIMFSEAIPHWMIYQDEIVDICRTKANLLTGFGNSLENRHVGLQLYYKATQLNQGGNARFPPVEKKKPWISRVKELAAELVDPEINGPTSVVHGTANMLKHLVFYLDQAIPGNDPKSIKAIEKIQSSAVRLGLRILSNDDSENRLYFIQKLVAIEPDREHTLSGNDWYTFEKSLRDQSQKKKPSALNP